jgi:hypothetical protein
MKNQKQKIYKLFVPLMVEKAHMTENSRVTKRLGKNCPTFEKSSQISCQFKKAKIYASKLNYKVQNI